tara:strand:+ start:321 stop:629 length:309 start_codon:yes stop_codon:yes gene_type:complete
MKKLILTALMIPLFVQAARPDTCLNIKNVASATMQSRQVGMDAQDVVDIMGKQVAEDWLYRAHMHIVIDAYQTRVYETDMYRNKVIREFANKYYIACWKGSM